MSRLTGYFSTQLKRTLKVYPAVLIFTVALTACVLILLGTMFREDANSVANSKIRIGMVGDTSETYLDIGISAVQEFDSSKYYVEFIDVGADEAETMLKRGDLDGYVIVPDGFVESIVSGENKPLTYVSQSSPATLGPLVINEVVKLVSDLLTEAQSGIYAMIDVGDEVSVETDDAVTVLNIDYISTVLERESFYEVEFIGIGNGLGFADYYYHAFFVLLMMLWGMTMIHLRVSGDMSLPRMLKFRGVGAFGQTLCEYLPFGLVIGFNSLVLTMLSAAFGKRFGIGFAAEVGDVSDYLRLALALIPAVAVISAMQFFVYEISRNIMSGVLLQLVVTVGLSYASGFFYPLSSFPETVRRFAEYLPTRIVFNYTSTVFSNIKNPAALFGCAIYFGIFVLLSFAVRAYKIRSDRV